MTRNRKSVSSKKMVTAANRNVTKKNDKIVDASQINERKRGRSRRNQVLNDAAKKVVQHKKKNELHKNEKEHMVTGASSVEKKQKKDHVQRTKDFDGKTKDVVHKKKDEKEENETVMGARKRRWSKSVNALNHPVKKKAAEKERGSENENDEAEEGEEDVTYKKDETYEYDGDETYESDGDETYEGEEDEEDETDIEYEDKHNAKRVSRRLGVSKSVNNRCDLNKEDTEKKCHVVKSGVKKVKIECKASLKPFRKLDAVVRDSQQSRCVMDNILQYLISFADTLAIEKPLERIKRLELMMHSKLKEVTAKKKKMDNTNVQGVVQKDTESTESTSTMKSNAKGTMGGQQGSEEQGSEEESSKEQSSKEQSSKEQNSKEQSSKEQSSEEQSSFELSSEELSLEELSSEELGLEELGSEELGSEEQVEKTEQKENAELEIGVEKENVEHESVEHESVEQEENCMNNVKET